MRSPRRPHLLQCRTSTAEYDQVLRDAERAGLSLSDFMRHCLCSTPVPRTHRLTRADTQLFARLLGQIGKIGSNLNQIARAINMGADSTHLQDRLEKELDGLQEVRRQLKAALGRSSVSNDNQVTDDPHTNENDHQIILPGGSDSAR